MRTFTYVALLAAALFGLGAKRTVSDDEVRRVQQSALLIDTHNDVTSRTVAGFDIGKRSVEGHTDVPRLREGGVGAQFFAVFVAASYAKDNRSAHRALEMIDTVRHDIVEGHPDQFQLATTAAEIETAHNAGKIAALMGIEGGHAIEDSLRLLRDYYDLGVRYMTLTHGNTNHWADSSGDIKDSSIQHHNGLTDFGKNVIREMNRLGMMVDISHVSDKTFWDALETSRAPIFASHSSARAISNIPRNMSDEMIVALAKKGGVVQINFGCDFLSQKYADATAPMRAKFQAMMSSPEGQRLTPDEVRNIFAAEQAGVPRPTIEDVVAHIGHIVRIAGVDAVGIGSDFDGVGCTPSGLDDVSKFPNLTRPLLESGYSAADIRKIYGGNLLRVMRAVERARTPAPAVKAIFRPVRGLEPVIDTHNDVTSATVKGFDIGSHGAATHTDIGRLRQGGVGAIFFAAYVDAEYVKTNQSAHRALEMIDTVRRDIVDHYNGDFAMAASVDEIKRAWRSRKIAALIGIEGGHAIEDSPRLLRQFYNLGVRYMTLTHVNTNNWADSSGDADDPKVQHHNGLTPQGRDIVREMNRIGMIVDISHVADKTFRDALEISTAPLIASHSSCRALTEARRNMTDEMIASMAKRGGTIQINFNCGFISTPVFRAESALEKTVGLNEEEFKKAYASGSIPRASLADVVAHINQAWEAGGLDAVGIGSDFDGVPCTPAGLDDVSKFPDLARALRNAGYSEADIRRIYSQNTLRLMRAVEAARR
jgi:membrane dipeptidase